MSGLNWKRDIQEASREVAGGTRLLLMYFSGGKECEGSEKMTNDTLKDREVVNLVERETLPLMFNVKEDAGMAEKYHIDWTPAFVLCDENGIELERFVGYLPAREFVEQLTLSKGLSAFHLGRLDEAKREFEMIIEDHAGSELVPEAEYYLGATRFKETGDTFPLAEICHTLTTTHPESLWAKRCSVWSHVFSEGRKAAVPYDQGGSAGSGAY